MWEAKGRAENGLTNEGVLSYYLETFSVVLDFFSSAVCFHLHTDSIDEDDTSERMYNRLDRSVFMKESVPG